MMYCTRHFDGILIRLFCSVDTNSGGRGDLPGLNRDTFSFDWKIIALFVGSFRVVTILLHDEE